MLSHAFRQTATLPPMSDAKDRDDKREHQDREQSQPHARPDQPAEEVDLDEKDPSEEGRTNVDVHEGHEDENSHEGQSLPPRKRDAEGKDARR